MLVFSCGIEEYHENLSHDYLFRYRDSNMAPSECEEDALKGNGGQVVCSRIDH
jgi:hypothetical protein